MAKHNVISLFLIVSLIGPVLLMAQVDTVSIHLIDTLLAKAQVTLDQQDPGKGLDIIAQAEARALELAGDKSYAYGEAIFQHGRILRQLGKNDEAEEKYIQSLTIYRSALGEQHHAVARNLFNLAALQVSTGRYEEGEVNLNSSLAIRRAIYGKNHLATVDNLNWLVEVHFRKGQYDRALTYVDTALGILIPQVDDSNPEYAKSLYWKAILLGVKGDYGESEVAYRKLLDIRIKVLGKDDPETVSVMSNLGLLYWKVGRYAEAEEYWLETVRINEKVLGPEHPKTVRAVGNMGIFYFDTGNMEKAEVFFLRNLKGLAETKGKEDPDYARALNNLSSFYQDQGDPEKAEPLVREGLEIIERKMGRNHPDFAIPLYNFGSLNYQLGRWDAARAAFRETEMIRRQTLGQHHYDLGLTLTALGRLERSQGNLVAADTCINEAIAILAESVGEGHPDYVSALIERVQLDMLQDDKEKVVAVFRDISRLDQEAIQRALFYLSDAEILKYIYRLQSHQNMLLVYASQTANPELAGIAYDETLFLKGFLLYARQKMVKAALDNPDSKVIYDQLKEEYTQLAREMSKLQSDRDTQLVIQLVESTNQLEKDLARTVGKLGIEMGTVRWEDVQSHLKPEEVAIEFVSLQPLQGGPAEGTTYAALILKPGETLPQIKTLFQESELADLLDVKTDRRSDYVNDLYAYADRGLAPTEKERKSLMELIWKPLTEEIEHAKTVYVSPAGILHRLNIAAIPVSEDAVLADQLQMVFLGSTRNLVNQSDDHEDHTLREAMIFGGIQFDPDSLAVTNPGEKPISRGDDTALAVNRGSRGNTWSYLTWTAREAKTIAEIMTEQGVTAKTFSGDLASEESFKELAGHRVTRILHMATHGFFFPDPAISFSENPNEQPAFESADDPMIRSGLVLANGNYAWQYGQPLASGMEDGILTALEISQLDLSGTELVVLSACETGLGDIQGNEGVYGLQRAFKIAGAKYLIMSLWQVPDRETMQFMTTFYRNWLEEKMNIPDAFRKTQLEMRDRFFNPYSWAGFVLVE